MAKRNPTGTPYNPPELHPRDLPGGQPPEVIITDKALDVTLVNVDAHVLAGVSLRDAVVIQLATSPIQVGTLVGLRIGDVAAADEAEVRSAAKTAGRVVKVEKGFLTCVIRIVQVQ